MRRLGYRRQRTLSRPAEVSGVGLLTGASVRLRFLPAPAHAGVVFVRTDVSPPSRIPAHVSQVTGTDRRTTLGFAPRQVMLVEHALAALAGLRVDNCLVELNAPEPPGLDGSAKAFVDALVEADFVTQPARRPVWTVEDPLMVEHAGATLVLHPHDGPFLRASYRLDYGPGSPIPPQAHTTVLTPESFVAELAMCRTFLLEEEARAMVRQGIGKHLTASDLPVFGPRGVIDNELRFADEPARHKLLDLVGDLSLFGLDVAGHVVAYRSGHPLNVELVRALARRLAVTQPPPAGLQAA